MPIGRRPHSARLARSGVAVPLVALALAACSNSTAGRPSVATSTVPSSSSSAPSSPTSSPPVSASVPSMSDSASGLPASSSVPASSSAPASSAPAPTAPPKRATVVVTYSGYDPASHTVSASAFVPSVLVPTASCTLVLTRDGVTDRVVKQAVPTANSMQCGTITKAGIAAGTWTGTIEFDSVTVRGASAPFTVQVTA